MVGKEKVRKVGRLDAENFPCQYLLKLEDVWGRASKRKFGFIAQSEILSKWKSERDFNILEKNFRDVVSWDREKSDSNIYIPPAQIDFKFWTENGGEDDYFWLNDIVAT